MKARFNKTFIALCLLLFVGCSVEDDFTTSSKDGGDSPRREVVLNLAMPTIDLPTVTRAATTDESAIEDVKVWAFDSSDRFLYQVESKYVAIRDNYIYVQLLEGEEKINLSIITNVKGATTIPSVGTAKADAVKGILCSVSASVLPTTIPMYGECKLDNGVQVGTRGTVSLKRALAKISVDASSVKSLLSISEVRLLNFNSEGTVCVAGEKSSNIEQMVFNDVVDNQFTFYVPEVANLFKTNRTSIVLSAKYKGSDNYYRLDFIVKDGSKVTEILRNHIYKFNISNVGGTGYSKLSDAMNFNNPASNEASNVMSSDLVITDETIMDITTDGTYYLGVTQAEIIAGKNSNCYYANFSIVTNNPNGWEILELPSGVDVSLPSFKSSEVVSKSVWIYIELTADIPADRKIDIYVFSANIRKRIQVTLPN